MLVVFEGRILNLDNVVEIDKDEGFSYGYFINFYFNVMNSDNELDSSQICFQKEQERDEAFEQILNDYRECKRVCILD